MQVKIKACIVLCEERKAEMIRFYDIRQQSVLADYCVICTATSSPHLKALAKHIQKYFIDQGIRVHSVQGKEESAWILMDYGEFLIHLFLAETRAYYNLEALLTTATLIYPEKLEDRRMR